MYWTQQFMRWTSCVEIINLRDEVISSYVEFLNIYDEENKLRDEFNNSCIELINLWDGMVNEAKKKVLYAKKVL